jgi:hypothetical protein
MIIVIVEAALRSLVLAVLVWLGVKVLRIRNPHIERAHVRALDCQVQWLAGVHSCVF